MKTLYYYLLFVLLIKKRFKPLSNKKNIILVESFQFKPSLMAFSLFALSLSKIFDAKVIPYEPNYSFSLKKKIKNIFLNMIFPFNLSNVYKVIFNSNKILNPKRSLKIAEVDKIFNSVINKIKNKKDLLNLKIKNILVGDLFYDDYLRTLDVATIDINNKKFKVKIYQYISVFLFWYDVIEKKEIKALISSHNVYLIGLPSRIAIYLKKPTYSLRITDSVYLTKKNPRAFGGFMLYPKIFNKLKNKEKVIAIKNSKKQLFFRFRGGNDELYKKNQENDTSVFLDKKIYINKQKTKKNYIKILIAAHCFTDAPHVYGKGIFCDFYDWIDFLGQQSNLFNYKWYIKIHPADYDRNLSKFKYFLEKYPKFQLLNKKTTHNQLIKKGIDAVLTMYGSIAHEYPLFNIPVINASINPHMAYDFSITPKTLAEYKNIINSLPKIKVKKNYQKQIYEFYYCNFLSDNTPFRAILNGNQNKNSFSIFKDFYEKKLNLNIDEIVQSYAKFIKSKKMRFLATK
jgi:hypothetical protein